MCTSQGAGVDLIIAFPTRKARLSDYMCGAGDIISILDQRTAAAGNRRRQTVLLSATLHSNLGALATLSLTQPVSVGIK